MTYCRLRHFENACDVVYRHIRFEQYEQNLYARRVSENFKQFRQIEQFVFVRQFI